SASSPEGTGGTAASGGPTGSTAPVAKPGDRSKTPSGPVPVVTGPVSGGTLGKPNSSAPPPLLSDAGYVEEEFFLSGTASSYQADGNWAQDGMWTATADQTADYTTRALVRRPTDPAKFNGTVLVEWLNVSGGADLAVDFGYLSRE